MEILLNKKKIQKIYAILWEKKNKSYLHNWKVIFEPNHTTAVHWSVF